MDRDVASSHKPSLAGMHRGSSLHDGGYHPQGTIVSANSARIDVGSTSYPCYNDVPDTSQDEAKWQAAAGNALSHPIYLRFLQYLQK